MRTRPIVLLLAFSVMLAVRSGAQTMPTTGVPQFGSFSGGPDVVNNANLNIHYTIPIFSKRGRGTNFGYALSYDSSIWYQVFNGSATVWEPVPSWGWSGGLTAASSYLLYSMSYQEASCGPQGYGWYYETWTFSNFVLHDSVGTPHSFPLSASYTYVNGNYGCPASGPSNPNGSTAQSDEYTVSISAAGPGYISLNSLTGEDGANINVPFVTTPPGIGSTSSVTDRNGNKITVNNGVYTDTLGTQALTITNSGSTYTYPTPAGGTANVQISYENYTVRTNFGCSGTSEFGPTNESLVSKIALPDGTSYQFAYESTPGYPGDVTGRVASVTLPTGGIISYTYIGGHNGIVCSGDGMNSTAGLERFTPDSGSGYWTYSRTIGTYPNPDTTTITDPQGSQTVITFPEYSLYEIERDINQVENGSQNLLEKVYTCYNAQAGNTPPCTSANAPISTRAVTVSLPSNGNTIQSKTVTTYNTSELPTEVDEYGYGSGGFGALMRKTLTSYQSLGNGIADKPSSITIEDDNSTTVAQTLYTYDQGSVAGSGSPQLNGVSGSRGNATTIQYLVSGSTYLQKSFTYYDNGNVNTATDVNGAVTTYGYTACGNSFPTTITEPIDGMTGQMGWNCDGGVQTSATDESGNSVAINYTTDAQFWRPNSVTDQMSNTTNLYYSGQTSAESSLTFNSNSSTNDVLSTLDSLGRQQLAQTRQAPYSGSYDSVETDYDPLGRPDRTTMPYAGTAGELNSSAPAVTTTYDALGRVHQVVDADGGTTTYTYNQNDVLAVLTPAPSGESPKQRQYEYDALGRLTSVCEVTSASGSGPCGQNNAATGYFTQYSYDALGDLTSVTQGAQARSYWYDGLGRMTKETNPESGTTSYSWDSATGTTCGNSNGDLVKRVDAANDWTCFDYDSLHRVTDVGNSNQNGTNVCKRFRYDNSPGYPGSAKPSGVANTLGRLIEAATDLCENGNDGIVTDEWFSYNARGELTDIWESTLHSGRYYHASAAYWPNGVLDSLTEATSGYGLTYSVDGAGRIYSSGYPAGSTNYLSSTTYNAAGQPTTVALPSGDSDTFSYDGNSGRMTQYNFNVNGQSDVGTLTWNSNGTLANLSITDPFNASNSQTCAYVHDDLSRISSAECGGNALSNPGFESGNTGWSLGSGYSIVDNPSNAESGSWYLSESGDTQDYWAVATPNGSQYIGVHPGQVLTFGGWVKRTGGTGVLDWGCEIVDASYNLAQWCGGQGGPGDGSGGTDWEFYSSQVTVPSNGAYVIFYAEVHGWGDLDRSATSGYFDGGFIEGASLWSQTFSYDAFGNLQKDGTDSFQPTLANL